IARQPILDTKLQLHGYELLFRGASGKEGLQPASATSHVIADSTMVFSWADLVDNARTFLNFSAPELLNGVTLLLPRNKTVIEITRDVQAGPVILAACRRLHQSGYAFAVDGFADLPEQEPLVDFADYLKVDFRETSEELQGKICERYTRGVLEQPKLIAKKV